MLQVSKMLLSYGIIANHNMLLIIELDIPVHIGQHLQVKWSWIKDTRGIHLDFYFTNFRFQITKVIKKNIFELIFLFDIITEDTS